MRKNISNRKGFSLVEVVIAIGIVAMLLTTFMAVFGPAQKKINDALGAAEANRLVHTLENEMAILRPGEETVYLSSFDKAFQWIKDSPVETSAVVVYQYQALPGTPNDDGTLQAANIGDINDDNKLPGVNYITQTVARSIDISKPYDPEYFDQIKNELSPGVVQGKVYVVRMTQLVQASGADKGLVLGTLGDITNPPGSVNLNPTDGLQYDDAYITLQVEFFQLNNNLNAYVTGGNWNFDNLGSPVVTQNIAVRR